MKDEEKFQAILDSAVDVLDRTRHFRKDRLAYQQILEQQTIERAQEEEVNNKKMEERSKVEENRMRNAKLAYMANAAFPGKYLRTKKPTWNVSRKLEEPIPSPVIEGRLYAAKNLLGRPINSNISAQSNEISIPPRNLRELLDDASTARWKLDAALRTSSVWGNDGGSNSRLIWNDNASSAKSIPKPLDVPSTSHGSYWKDGSISRSTQFGIPRPILPTRTPFEDYLSENPTPRTSRLPQTGYTSVTHNPQSTGKLNQNGFSRRSGLNNDSFPLRFFQEELSTPGVSSKYMDGSPISMGSPRRIKIPNSTFLLDPRVPPPSCRIRNSDRTGQTSSSSRLNKNDTFSSVRLPSIISKDETIVPLTHSQLSQNLSSLTMSDTDVMSDSSDSTISLKSRAILLEQNGLSMSPQLNATLNDIFANLKALSDDIKHPSRHIINYEDKYENLARLRPPLLHQRKKDAHGYPPGIQPKTSETYYYGFPYFTKSGAIVDSNTSLQSNVYPSPGFNNEFKMTVKHEKPWTPPDATEVLKESSEEPVPGPSTKKD